MALLPVEEALARLLSRAEPVNRTETVAIGAALGRVLAKPLAARLTQPPFDASAMDGYALRAADIASIGSKLTVIGESAAGRGFSGRVGEGQAVRIFTGAPMPEGADTVLLQEDALRLEDGRIKNTFVPERGRHVRPRGQDFAEGEIVLTEGMRLDAGRLLVAAGMNHGQVEVYARPKVAILSTGDELKAPGEELGPNQIVASNSIAVAALAREAGAEVIDLGIVPDDVEQIAAAARKAGEIGADVLVTLGGASVGDYDLVQSTLTSVGMELDFWKIAMRPGKPLMVGSLGETIVLGLPGNPVSSMVCALLFMEPLLHRLARLPCRSRERAAITASPLAENDRRQDYVRARAARDKEGRIVVTAFDKQDSSQMKIFALADALIIRPPHAPALEVGAECRILALREID